MPKAKKKIKNSIKNQDILTKKDDSINSTIMDFNCKTVDINHTKLKMWESEVKDKMNEAFDKLNNMQKDSLAMLELTYQTFTMKIPKNVLNTIIDINNEEFREMFLGIETESEGKQTLSSSKSSFMSSVPIKRRSKSANSLKYSTQSSSRRSNRIRSSSVDIYKTPKGTVTLSSIMSDKKYTVTKPKRPKGAENFGVNVKRVMKPNEEAISTCGSPLYVASCPVSAPYVNIPLPGGVVLNIEPKTPKGTVEVPGLDPKTKNQIKMLCEQLKQLC